MVTHMSQTFRCDTCSYTAVHDKDLRRHKRNMHPVQTPYACKRCDFCSPSWEQFQEHCQIVHEKQHETRIFNRNSTVKSKCHKCSYHAENRHDMARHLKNMHERKSHVEKLSQPSNISFPSVSPSTNSLPPTPDAAKSLSKEFHCFGHCSILQKSFDQQDEFDLHMSFFHATQ
jgi:hypothetical protein